MNQGEVIEAGEWLTGKETPERLTHIRGGLVMAMTRYCQAHGVSITPIRWFEKKPGEDRVPKVPNDIQGDDVRLLVAEAGIVRVVAGPGNFLADLEPKDLMRLRHVTRAAYARQYPKRQRLTDRQCDTIINDFGPEAAVAAMRRGSVTTQ